MSTPTWDLAAETNGALADSTHWTLGRASGTWTATIATDAGAPQGKSATIADNDWGMDGIQSWYFDDLANSTSTFEVVDEHECSSVPGASASPIGDALISAADAQDCYGLLYNGGGQWFLACFLDGNYDHAIGSGFTGFTPTAGGAIFQRIGRTSANVCKANIWGTSYASEPAGFNLAGATDTTIGNLRSGVAAQVGSFDATINGFGASDEGDKTATISTGGSDVLAAQAIF